MSTSIVSVVSFNPANAVLAGQMIARIEDCDTDADYYRRSLRRWAEVEGTGERAEVNAEGLKRAERSRYQALRRLGDLLANEDVEVGQLASVHGRLFRLDAAPAATQYGPDGVAEVPSCIAVYLGDAPLPGEDDDHDEVAERRHEYAEAIRVG